MDLTNCHAFDPNILLGIVNEKLRLECTDVGDLSSCYDMNAESVSNRLAEIGYQYDPLTNQFKAR
ncbi:DUF4250 domain-containing protein [Corallincola holothuriorum]|uniref:DUF4250 domain-containing protein n=1 Tax=Corallincola holothuriorum TaxID=2282215 RepID=A0A368NM09_9GAMM|nr:DUF4250 domain-containing protein [Corallincola holothuriorum]RCU50361.1 DUF4250 domain-containing protein [Corallincola holothuriorum]